MRVDNWPSKLADIIKSARDSGFCRGKLDCCLFSADVVLAITGVDYAKDFRNTYKDRKGAAEALKKFGMGNIRQTVTKLIGPEVLTLHARRGDLVLANVGYGNMLGVCVGEKAAFLAKDGLLFIKIGLCKTAWRVD